jgi:hypothetical protein
MTIRIIETILFGSLPVLPEDFTSPVKYVPNNLIVRDGFDMMNTIKVNKLDEPYWRDHARSKIILNLQHHDVHYFIRKIEKVVMGK